MTAPLDPALEIIDIKAEVTVLAGYWPCEAAYEQLEHQIREQAGGVVPPSWRDHLRVTFNRHRRAYHVSVEMRAIKHEHYPRRRWIAPAAWVETCWTEGCTHQAYHGV